jgi:peptide/nickel transport system substrate-binding protein
LSFVIFAYLRAFKPGALFVVLGSKKVITMKKMRIHLPLAFVAVLILFSCSPDKETPAWKHNDNTLRVRQPSAITTLNPLLHRNKYESAVFELIYQYPMGFDYEKLELVPQLIKAAPVVLDITEGEYKGGQSFTYEIHPEAVWDDGKPVTGRDFEFSLKAVFNPKMNLQHFLSYLEAIRDFEVDESNPKLFTVFTNQPYFLSFAGISNFIVLPEHVFDPQGLMKKFSLNELSDPAKAAKTANDPALQQFADFYNTPKIARETVSGSGPYKLVEWVDDQRVVLAKKQNWWGEKLAGQYRLLQAYPDTIVFIPIKDVVAANAAVKDESVDVAPELDAKLFTELRQVDFVKKIYSFETPPTFKIYMTTIQNRNPKLSDKRVRRALAQTVDMDLVIKDLYDSLAERIVGPFLPDQKYYLKSKPIAMNLDEARKLLAEAGWKDSNGNGIVDKTIDGAVVEMKLEYIFPAGSAFAENFALLMKSNAQKVGVEIEANGVDPKVLGQRFKNGEYELGGRAAATYPLPDDPKQLWHTDSAQPGGSNYAWFSNPTADALINKIQVTTDEAARNKLYEEFQQLIYDEQPVIFQLTPFEKMAVHQRFEPVISRMGASLQHFKLKK